MTISRKKRERIDLMVRAILADKFPKAFAPKGAEKWPLKDNIVIDIYNVAPEIGFTAIRRAVSNYCFGPTYCRSLIAGAARVDLEGKPAGVVTQAEADLAASKMEYFNSARPEAA